MIDDIIVANIAHQLTIQEYAKQTGARICILLAELDIGKGNNDYETYMTAPMTIGKERNLLRLNIIKVYFAPLWKIRSFTR